MRPLVPPALLALLALAGCGKDADDTAADPDQAGRDLFHAYVDALCRLYSDPLCVQNQVDTCGGSLSFESEADCSTFLNLGFASCDSEVYGAIVEAEATVTACIGQIEAVDCVDGAICDEHGDSAATTGACDDLDTLISPYCEQDTGA